MGKCKICGSADATCGPESTSVPTDLQVLGEKRNTMALKKFITTLRSGRTDVETIVKLTAEEGEKLGLEEYVKSKPKTRRGSRPATKARTASNKQKTPAGNKAPAANPADPGTESTPPESDAGADIAAEKTPASEPAGDENGAADATASADTGSAPSDE